MANIIIYTKDYCPYCDKAKLLLQKKSIAYTEINITNDIAQQEVMVVKSKRKTVPQIFINDQAIGGCDDLYQLEATGMLNSLLEGQ